METHAEGRDIPYTEGTNVWITSGHGQTVALFNAIVVEKEKKLGYMVQKQSGDKTSAPFFVQNDSIYATRKDAAVRFVELSAVKRTTRSQA